MRTRRWRLDADEHARLSEALCRNLAGWPGFLRARRFALFLSNDGEPDLDALYRRAAWMGKSAYLPVLHGRRLWFLPYVAGGTMIRNRFGIAEPSGPPGTRLKPFALDLVLVPLVAFDAGGHRLGMGGGFYDRSFAYLASRTRWRKPRLIGVAFDFQRVDHIPPRPWDVPLDGVMTERGFFRPGVADTPPNREQSQGDP